MAFSFKDSTVLVVVSVLVTLLVIWLAVWLLLKYRESSINDIDVSAQSEKDFEEMRLQGQLSPEEYRNITSLLERKRSTSNPYESDADARQS